MSTRPLMSRGQLFTGSQGTAGGTARRIGTAARAGMQTGGVGVGLSTDITVEDRPVTREGMFGMKTGNTTQKRQVQSASYYLGELHAKISMLTEELERLRNEGRKLQQDRVQSEVLVKKENDLKDELALLSNKARDLNVSVEKLQQFDAINAQDREPLEKLKAQYEKFKSENEKLKESNNEIFRKRNNCEESVREIEQKIQDYNDDLEDKLNIDLSKKNLFLSLKEERSELEEARISMEHQLRELNDYLMGDGGSVLSNDPQKQKYYEKLQEKRALEKRKQDVQNKLSGGTVTDEEKNHLMLQMKNDKQDTVRITEAIKQCKTLVNSEKEKLKQLQDQLDSHKGEKSKSYAEFKNKDAVLTKYMANFDTDKNKELKELADHQEIIVKLLDHISNNMGDQENLPTQSKLEEMKDDLAFKQDQKNISLSTLERLKLDLKQRKEELEKVNNLEQKITQDMKRMDESMREMKHSLETYNNIDLLKRQYEKQKSELVENREQLKLLKENLKTEMHLLSRHNTTLERKIKTNDIYTILNDLEQKIRVYEQNNFLLNDYITQKGAESDYTDVKYNTMKLVSDVIEMVKEESKQSYF
ncbi:hypothetical protein C9374_005117 [Naegleria lovaniensis]|uniref:Uncharacterized protein n=1 Tax=Naegleria lovaniensis TaxID=51637 RepID=A0AA88GQL6_NAELO|nr:uncharacterized protein C9374_005117 [Naegleria lovaniensis]KAG2382537.1 hypothetical protein C9374_005117 [Naegleria lovaniensis]